MARKATAAWAATAAVGDQCGSATFPDSKEGLQIWGLQQPLHSVASADDCAQACCDDGSCELWQWAAKYPAAPLSTCWLGKSGGASSEVKGWVGRGGRTPPAPPTP